MKKINKEKSELKKLVIKTKYKQRLLCDDNSDDDAADTIKCIICFDFGKSDELWYRCSRCPVETGLIRYVLGAKMQENIFVISA